MRSKYWIYVAVAAPILAFAQGRTVVRELARPTARAGSVKGRLAANVLMSRNVVMDVTALRDKNVRRVSLPLFQKDEKLELMREGREDLGEGRVLWRGRTLNDAGARATLVVVGETVTGEIFRRGGRVLQIRYIGNGVHAIRDVDQTKFKPEADPTKPPPRARAADERDTCTSDPPTDIDALVVYTTAARAAAGGVDAMLGTIYLAVALTNESYLNSNTNQRLRLVHAEEVTYTETCVGPTTTNPCNIATDRNRLQANSDGFLDGVHALRDTFAADVTALIVEDGGSACGIAYIMDPVANTFEDHAFAVVERNCATTNLSFPHELGHLMSARHDWFQDSTNNSPFTHNHGFVEMTPTVTGVGPWRTVMAYNNECAANGLSCTRLPYFSNPNVDFPAAPGDAMGVAAGAQRADNHLTLDTTAATVANFRCGSPGVANVWMKDTWNDTGVEPDPATAGEPMWMSPYIWVRNARDANSLHQHEHQNPEYGAKNWVYVKLQNGGGGTASGDLELFYANASTSLEWPAGWTKFATVPVSGFAAGSAEIVEAEWSSVPGTGHYCMVARWVSASDPMTHVETSDIGQNVRNNNNLVWRNLNVVDLVTNDAAEVTLDVRALSQTGITLAIRAEEFEGRPSFFRTGQVEVRLDDTLRAAWNRTGAKRTGLKKTGALLTVRDHRAAEIKNLKLAKGSAGKMKLSFKRGTKTPRGRYLVHVLHLAPARSDGVRPVVGGVTYEIRTDHADEP